MHTFLTVVVLMSLVLAVTSESDESKRAKSCGMRAGSKGNCRSNISFIKRIYDAYKRGGVDTESPNERGWAELEDERRANDATTMEEKLRMLNELLDDLELYDNNMK